MARHFNLLVVTRWHSLPTGISTLWCLHFRFRRFATRGCWKSTSTGRKRCLRRTMVNPMSSCCSMAHPSSVQLSTRALMSGMPILGACLELVRRVPLIYFGIQMSPWVIYRYNIPLLFAIYLAWVMVWLGVWGGVEFLPGGSASESMMNLLFSTSL